MDLRGAGPEDLDGNPQLLRTKKPDGSLEPASLAFPEQDLPFELYDNRKRASEALVPTRLHKLWVCCLIDLMNLKDSYSFLRPDSGLKPNCRHSASLHLEELRRKKEPC